MADETTADKPLANLAGAERNIDDPKPRSMNDGMPTDADSNAGPLTAAGRLRAFEDEHFGKEAVRIRDQIERGSGSPYQMATPEVRAQHKALEKLIVTEQKLADAHGALLQAEADHEAALAAVDKADAE